MNYQVLVQMRRSIRSYAEQAVPREDLEKILEIARQAPSWKNGQPARMYVAYTPEMIQKVAKALPEFNQKSSKNAALVVTTFVKGVSGFGAGQPTNEGGDLWGAYDLGLHDSYMILAAADLGYDSLIMGIRDEKKLREVFSIGEEEQVMSVIAIGRRKGEAAVKPRKELSEVAVFA
ncbi:MAG: nitroreductase family protein [Blautia sp.]|nr:nitroreductase family protein [Blautia sp.]